MKIPINVLLHLTLCTRFLATAMYYRPPPGPRPPPKTGLCVKEIFVHDTPIATDKTKFLDFIRYSDMYVDKSLLIKDIMEREEKLVVITRPRKWAKSINLDMIKTFLQMEMREDGNHTDPKETNSYKYFKHGLVVLENGDVQKLKQPPLISKYDEFIDKNLGRHPVMYFNFAKVTGTRLEKIEYRIGEMIADTFEAHHYIEGHLKKRYDEIAVSYESQFKPERAAWDDKLRHYRNTFLGYGFTEDAFARSVQFLSEVLYDMFHKPVIVLIDGYDTTIKEMMFRNYKSNVKDDERMFNFFANFMKYSFENNPYVAKGILVGVSGIADEPYFSKYNYRTDYNIINNDLSEYIDFNEYEMNAMCHQLNISAELSRNARLWYRGYKIGSNAELVYNPWSIVNFLNTRKVSGYWVKTGAIDFFLKMMKYEDFRNELDNLFTFGNLTVNFNYLHFKKIDLLTMKHLVQDEEHKLDRRTIDLIFTYLCTIGYLTFKENVYRSNVGKSETVGLCAPNKEITEQLADITVSFYANYDKKDER